MARAKTKPPAAPPPPPPPEPPPRKISRLGLYIPFGLLLAVMVGWSGLWFVARAQTEAGLKSGAEALKQAGYNATWRDPRIDGFPFRLNITLTDARLSEASGWALETPKLEAQAHLYAPGRWVLAAPQGLVFTRPAGGAVAVDGKLIRASLSRLTSTPPNLSFEGVGLSFRTRPGAEPFVLAAADRVEFHLRAGPDDEGGVFAKLDAGKARPDGALARIAQERPVSLVWNSTVSKASAFKGRTWPEAVRAWSAAGGRMTVREAGLTAGDASLGASGGSLGVDGEGLLSGVLPVSLRQASHALAALADAGVLAPETARAASVVVEARQTGPEAARATLTFQAGRMTLGPVAVAPAPRVRAAD
jgi:hypothetical protein